MEDSSNTTAPARRSRALIALAAVIGLLVGIAAFSYGSATDRTPTATVQMVLDEDQTGWPFYAAVQEEAEAFIADPDVVAAAQTRAGTTSGTLRVDRPGDLSIFTVVATGPSDDAALELADAGAAEIIDRSRASRQSTEGAELESLGARRDELQGELDALASQVDRIEEGDQSSDALLTRSSFDSTSRELNDLDRSIADLETARDATGSAYRALGAATIEERSTSAALTAVTAGAAAAVLSLLALSFLAGPAPTAATAATATASSDAASTAAAAPPASAKRDERPTTPGSSGEKVAAEPVARSRAFGPNAAAPPSRPATGASSKPSSVAKKPPASPSTPAGRSNGTSKKPSTRPASKDTQAEPDRSSRRADRKR